MIRISRSEAAVKAGGAVTRALRRGSTERAVGGAILTGLVAQAGLLVSGVVLARLFGPERRGQLALIVVLPIIVYQIGNLGLPIATAFYVARVPGHARELLHTLRGVITIQALLLIVAHAALVVLIVWHEPSLQAAAVVSLIWAPLLLIQDYGLAVLQGQKRFRSFNILRALPAGVNVSVALFVLTTASNDIAVVVTGLVTLTAALAAATLAIALVPSADQSTSGSQTAPPSRKELLAFGAKALVGSSYPVETLRLDQLIVALFLTAYDLGLYVVALSFINLPRFISQSIGTVAYPHVASRLGASRRSHDMWLFVWFTTGTTALLVCILELLAPALLRAFFGPEFESAQSITRLLLAAALLLAIRRILGEVLKGAGNPAASSIAEGVSLVVVILTMPVLTRYLGLLGAGVALSSSAAISMIILIYVALRQRFIDVMPPYEHPVLEEDMGSASVP